jgi:hypothetical protein
MAGSHRYAPSLQTGLLHQRIKLIDQPVNLRALAISDDHLQSFQVELQVQIAFRR